MSGVKHPLSASLRSAPLPLPGGEETAAVVAAPIQLGFLAPGQGERWSEGPERGCFAPLPGGIS